MNKIKQFLKKYWLWLLIGFLLGLIILLFFLLSREETEEVVPDVAVENITSPYHARDERVTISVDAQEESFQEREWIYSVSRPSERMFTSFVERFYEIEEIVDMNEEIIISKGDDLVWYHANIGVLSIFSEGLVLDLKITGPRDVTSFFTQYFGIREVSNEKIETTERGTLYAGYFEYEDQRIGSSNLEGYAYKLELDQTGRLIEFSMLLLAESDIERFQPMSTAELSELLGINNYPMKVVNETIEERFFDQPGYIRGSGRLSNFTTKNVELLFLLNDFEDEYILPTYQLSGDGELVDSQGAKYWTKSHIFISAIDPEYLYEKPIEDYREKPHSDPTS
jgi:hypothetical protein